MLKPFRAAMLPKDGQTDVTVMARSDLGAVAEARHVFGPGTSFELWDGERFVLTYRPLPALQVQHQRHRDQPFDA